ncbi:RNA polymerase sigma factor [Nonomuraea endophytica]|uniref:RNA polymerase sigma factor (Sigma-70 family) n=1 Tax=Nonomuraea endophytica TaxID=714136 RepID=A0A7W8EGA8_9ACTN|nr:sigma-70 family RNA polymerase sigma factor [Nonomuraea endophytica]MBB5077367.1 RNA polymerase sigma factor (sigma-70 family) [Nonomuraea endophytica]
MRDDPEVVDLVTRARKGDRAAWDEIVERYSPLVWSICRRFRLVRPDSDDAAQTVWLRLVENLDTLREPAALPGWLARTAHRECLRRAREIRRRDGAERPLDFEPETGPDLIAEELEKAERDLLLRRAFAQLPPRCRDLLTLCLGPDPVPYAQIGERLGMPVGGIGPNRSRCLARLRRILEGGGHAAGS